MKITVRSLTNRITKVFDSPKTFWCVFGFFLFSAVWIALSGAYSMAFDEYVHYGVTKLYEGQWSPFLSSQPFSADAYGAITRDGSYFYHYIMSFPLRVFDHFVSNFVAQILFLRFFSIAFFAGGILFFRAAFKRANLSNRTTNLVLGFFMLLPVVPLAAAQVNYDTMLFLLVGICMWLSVRVSNALYIEKRLPVALLVWLWTTAMFAGIVKYAFLPILVALTIYFFVVIWRTIGFKKKVWSSSFRAAVKTATRWQIITATVLFLIGTGLFAERYGLNVLRYHTPTPECNQVMALERCMSYEPFARNYNYTQGNYKLETHKIYAYPFNNWMRGMLRSMLHVVSSKTKYGYFAGEPFLLTHILGFIVMGGGLIASIVSGRWLWRRSRTNQLFIVVSATYALLLFAQNFMDFLHTHVPVAIQGRYLLPILPLYLLLVVQAYTRLLSRVPRAAKAGLLVLFCFMLLQGGSLLPFVIRQHDDWIWDAPIVRTVNHAAKNVLEPVIISKEVWIFD